MILDKPVPFSEAVKMLAQKNLLPTSLDSAGIRAMDATLRNQSLLSAKTLNLDLLAKYKAVIESVINPTVQQREDRITEENPEGNVTTGLNPTYARVAIQDFFKDMGIRPSGDDGGLTDLTSNARINLVVETNSEMAQGAGRFIQSNDEDVVDEFPAQELYRLEDTKKHRDWEARWRAAAEESGDEDAADVLENTGRMVALKASPIWDSLGNGAGGYDDSLGNPYPPFAFNSGMWVQSVARDDAESLGLIKEGQKAEAHPLDLTDLFSTAE
ncbi:MAG TPA: hypothetical protein VG347_04290 [Verrucomicrobiae bacterium]|nr:hypothetical protein [Verrucomicrobiae bacterium]